MKDIIEGTVIESSRIEFKSDWNPEPVLHTICAFANDYQNLGGGYIVLGVVESEGVPVAFPGIEPTRLQKIENELSSACKKITPSYMPEVSVEKYRDANMFVIWAPIGESRPYKCPVTLSEKKSESAERAYYIRQMSRTVRTNPDEELNLVRIPDSIPFDNRVNMTAPVTEIRETLVHEYLANVDSEMDYRSIPSIELFRSLRIARGAPESIRPVNIGLMMFSYDPEKYFPGTRIEIVYMPSEGGSDMDETTIRGPVDHQIRDALRLINNLYIREKVLKLPDRMESLRIHNFPELAVKETLVNAMYHRDYSSERPVKVYIRPDRIEIINSPGPNPSITDRMIAENRMRSDYNINSRLGDFLRELGLTEGRNSGIPKVLRSLEENGSDPPIYETDAARSFLRVTIPVHSAFLPSDDGKVGPVSPKGSYRDPAETKRLILESLRVNGCQTSKDLAASVGYSGANNTFRRCLMALMAEGEAEYLYPDKPRDKRQKVCLSRR